MTSKNSKSVAVATEVEALIATLAATERRLEELTGGEVGTVVSGSGTPFLLRRAQEELRNGEGARQAVILDSLPAHIAVLNAQGLIVTINEAWRQFGIENSLIGESCGLGGDYLAVCDRAGELGTAEAVPVAAGIRSVLAGANSFTLEYSGCAGGQQWWFLLTVAPLINAGSRGVLVMHENITERKAAEAALLGKTAFLEAQVASSIDGILVVDAQGRKSLQNQRMVDLFDIPREIAEDKEDKAQRCWVTAATKNPEQFAKKLSYLNAHPDEVSQDEIELKKGTILDRNSAPVIGKDGKYYGRIWTFRDVTARRRIERELKRARIDAVRREGVERYQFLADSVPLIIWTARPDGGVDYFNKAWFDYTGLTLAQTQNFGWEIVVHPDDRDRSVERWAHSFTTGEDYEIEYRFRRAHDNTYRWFLGRASAHRDGEGGIVQWVGTGTDIDDQKRARSELEARVAERTRELSTSNEALHAENTTRRQTEVALRASNEKFHQLADNISDAFWVRSPDMSEVQYVSPAFEKIWGRTVKSLQANPQGWSELIFPADHARVVAAFAALKDSAPNLDIKYRIVRPSGEVRWVRVRGAQVRNGDDHLIRHVGIVTDITENRIAEEALRESQDLLTVASSLTRMGAWSVKIPELTLSLSEGARQIHEMPADFFPTVEENTNCYVPADRPTMTRVLESCMRDGTPFDVESQIITTTGKRVWVRSIGKATRDDAGDIHLVRGSVQDISRHKLGEIALRASEQRFRALFDQAAVGVALAHATTGRFATVNQRFADIAGRDRQELEKLTFASITHPKDLARDLEMLQRLRAGSLQEYTREKRYVRKNGSEVWVNFTVSAMWAPGEEPDLCIAVVQDITARKQLEEQMMQAQKMEAIGTLAGGIAHDFNNILAVISGYTELARITLANNPTPLAHLGAVMQAVKRAVNLVRQILVFSRPETLERAPTELSPLVQETFDLLRATIPSTIEFDLFLASDAPTVLADPTQVHQILMNLGTNAWHAMRDQTGRLTVRLERVVVDQALATVKPQLHPGLYARISVSDTGKGMSPITINRIFDPFFTTKAPGEGTGLGLAVVHGIMDNHDGAIMVESQPDVGTVFRVYFPADTGEVVVTATDLTAIPTGNGERILVVDDEQLLARMTQQALNALGYEAEYVTNPTDALGLVRADTQRFDLVLTDLTMPGMTGIVLADQLRQVRPDLPIILVTGYSAFLTTAHVQAQGLQDFLMKPTSIQSLGLAVHAALSPQSSA